MYYMYRESYSSTCIYLMRAFLGVVQVIRVSSVRFISYSYVSSSEAWHLFHLGNAGAVLPDTTQDSCFEVAHRSDTSRKVEACTSPDLVRMTQEVPTYRKRPTYILSA